MKLMGQLVRGLFLVAVVVAVVTTTNLLIKTASEGQATGSQSGYIVYDEDSAGPEVDEGELALADYSAIDDLNDDPSVLIDATEGDRPPSADNAEGPGAESSVETEELVATESDTLESDTTASLEEFSAEAAGLAKYQKAALASVSYGQGAGSIGLVSGVDKRPTGPVSFAVDKSGKIYVSDNVNSRIQVFSPTGKHLRSFPVQADAYDLTISDGGELFLLGTDGKLHVHDSATGRVKARWSVNSQAAEDLGKLRIAGGEVTLESPRQKTYTLARISGASSQAVSVNEQVSGQKQGAKAGAADYFTTTYRDGGHLYRYDRQGKRVQDIALKLANVETVVFLAEDKSGSLYVQVERLGSAGQVSVEVRQFSEKGALTAIVPISRIDYIQMTRSAVVTENGDIYQVLPTRQGVSLVRWQRS